MLQNIFTWGGGGAAKGIEKEGTKDYFSLS